MMNWSGSNLTWCEQSGTMQVVRNEFQLESAPVIQPIQQKAAKKVKKVKAAKKVKKRFRKVVKLRRRRSIQSYLRLFLSWLRKGVKITLPLIKLLGRTVNVVSWETFLGNSGVKFRLGEPVPEKYLQALVEFSRPEPQEAENAEEEVLEEVEISEDGEGGGDGVSEHVRVLYLQGPEDSSRPAPQEAAAKEEGDEVEGGGGGGIAGGGGDDGRVGVGGTKKQKDDVNYGVMTRSRSRMLRKSEVSTSNAVESGQDEGLPKTLMYRKSEVSAGSNAGQDEIPPRTLEHLRSMGKK